MIKRLFILSEQGFRYFKEAEEFLISDTKEHRMTEGLNDKLHKIHF
jgi:hypothetical protein